MDENGYLMFPTFSVEPYGGSQSIILNGLWGKPSKEYSDALRLLLARLGDTGAVLVDGMVDSSEARQKVPDEGGRRLVLRDGRDYPLALSSEDPEALRLAIQHAQQHIAQAPGIKGGNRTRRIRLVVEAGANPLPDDLEGFLSGGQVTPPEIEDALTASDVAGGKRPRRQGFRQDPAARRAIELRGMEVAQKGLTDLGATDVDDVSGSESYDFRCLLGGEEVHVEVKGTTSDGQRVLLTRNEVIHARDWHPNVALVVVSGIVLTTVNEEPHADGGLARIIYPWQLADDSLEPIFVRVHRPTRGRIVKRPTCAPAATRPSLPGVEPGVSLSQLQAVLERFRDAREWSQFHSPRNLAAAIAVEAGELQDLFLWSEDGAEVLEARRAEVEQELADVLIQALNLANAAGIDAGAAIGAKIALNEHRYPAHKARGTAKKWVDL